jgi:ubiquinone/menaquinone biosynthesis C-methylase UbiE
MSISEYNLQLIEEMNRYYEVRAPVADIMMSYSSNAEHERRLQPIVDLLTPLATDQEVLEIACGTGNWTQVLAKRASSVVAIDQSPTALAIAKRKLTNFKNTTLKLGDVYNLEGIDEKFSVVFASDFWSHIPNGVIPFFLETVRKNLVRGARLVLMDMQMNDYFEQEPCCYDSDNNRIGFRKAEDGVTYRVVKNFPSEDDLRRVLSPVAETVEYKEFSELKRWMVICNLR